MMKISGRNLKKRLDGRVHELHSRLSRARYFRGHGVHSPYVYEIVRKVFMRKTLLDCNQALFDALLAAGVGFRRAVELQNLATHCNLKSFGLNCADPELCVLLPDFAPEQIWEVVRAAEKTGATVVILAPNTESDRKNLCNALVAGHKCTSVDNRGYLLLFNNHLPKQHFCL